MSWSVRLGRLAGIDVYVHVTFLILLAFLGLSRWRVTGDAIAALANLGFIISLFVCVLLHEFGHALMARRYGIATRDITLLPIGGLARLERMPEKPMQEFWVALAGPAVNVVIAGALVVYLAATQALVPVTQLMTSDSFLVRLYVANVALVLFNMLPAFPLDGGRVLRAILATRLTYARATTIAARLGKFMALVFGFIGLSSNPFLVLIAFFVWISAAQEENAAQLKYALEGVPMQRLMITDFRTLTPLDPLSLAAEHVLAGFQHDFPVVDTDGGVVGVLTRGTLIGALAERGPAALTGDVMARDFRTADSLELAEGVLERLGEARRSSLPVLQRGRLVGIFTAENLGEFMMIQSALRKGALRSATS